MSSPVIEHDKSLQFEVEEKRLADTIDYIESAITATAERRDALEDDIREAFIDLDPMDSSLSYVRIMTDSKFLDDLEKNFRGLLKARKKPYFCRIDYQADGSNELQKLYIGKMSLTHAQDNSFIIVDWRAPISSVYYDGRVGHVTYQTPAGTQQGELFLKRQFSIEGGKLLSLMDVDITATDAFLQAALGENKDNRLKDIVSTIQDEQNAIIRADIGSPLIVQGAAGSGKTTIALHRIAYLIYTYEATFDPDDFMIIAPNRLFLDYISEVLPELGVEQVRQTTFVDLAQDMTGIHRKLAGSDEKLVQLISPHARKIDTTLALIRQISGFKGSLAFRDLVDNYVKTIEANFLTDADFCLYGQVVVKAQTIRNMFLEELTYLPLFKRTDEIKKTLKTQMKRVRTDLLKHVMESHDRRIAWLMTKPPTEERKASVTAAVKSREDKLAAITKEAKTAVVKFLSRLPKRDLQSYYEELVTSPSLLLQHAVAPVEDGFFEHFSTHHQLLQQRKQLEFEDLTVLLYLQHRLFGFDKKLHIKYMVIDEAQDFSLFQLYTLKEVFNTKLFTLLGDLAQGIYAYRGIQNWQEVVDNIFPNANCKFLTLEQSYRTTVEIMNIANCVIGLGKLPGIVPAKPVLRHGDEPKLYRYSSNKQLVAAILDMVQARLMKHKTIALITKTPDAATHLQQQLMKLGLSNAHRLCAQDDHYEGGVVVLPAHLSKGLEFDAVLICMQEDEYLNDPLDLKLLYVAMTRALHRLDVLCLDTNMHLLSFMNESNEHI